MARRARQRSKSLIYHIMMRGVDRQEIFCDDEDRFRFIETLKRYKSEKGFEIYAYCIMNNHVHLLMNEKDYSISDIMKSINISYAMYFNKKYRRIGYLFQNRFNSEAVNDDEYLVNVIRYIHNNPVKAGITIRASEYQWSSYTEYVSTKGNAELIDKSMVLNYFNPLHSKALDQFARFSNENDRSLYLDITEPIESSKKLNTLEGALSLVTDYLNGINISLDELRLQKGKIIRTAKHELIRVLKDRTILSCREIAELVGTNKSTVHKT